MSPLVIGIIIAVVLVIAIIVFIVLSTPPTPTPTSVPTPSPTSGQVTPSPLDKVDCKVSDWTIPSDSSCSVKSDGTGSPSGWYATRTRTVINQPQNGGMVCPSLSEEIVCPPVDCQIGSPTCTTDLKIQKSVLVQPKFGGKECPPLLGTNIEFDCISNEVCSTIYNKYKGDLSRFSDTTTSGDSADTAVWKKFNCNKLKDELSKASLNKTCDELQKLGDQQSLRARFLLGCPGTVLEQGNFIGAGNLSDKYFTITIGEPISMGDIPQISTDNGGALKNIGNQIRFFYDNNLSLTGWAVTKDWVYPKSLNGLTVKDFGIITPTSAWEISDQPTGNLRNKILVYFVSNNITPNNPQQAIRDIVNKAITNLQFGYGADVRGSFLGSQYFNGTVEFNDSNVLKNAKAISSVAEKVCVGLIGKYPMTPRVSWSKGGKETYPVALRASTFTPLNCDQYYKGETGNPINGQVSIDQMCDAIKQVFTKQSDIPSSILAAYNDSCSSSSAYQLPQYIRNNNMYKIMTSKLNLQP